MTFIQGLDASGQPQVIPALAIAGASLDLRSDDAEAILHGLERLGSVMIAPLRDAEQAVRLAAVIARTGLDPWDAHVAAVADAAVCPILTLGAARWREHAADLDEPLHFIEIADPDEGPGGPGPGALGARSGTPSRHVSYLLPCFLAQSRVIPTSAARSGGEVGITEAAPAGRISPGSRPDGGGRRTHSAACPVPAPVCRVCGGSAGNAGWPAAGAGRHGGAPDHARSQVAGLVGGQGRPGGEAVQGPPHVGGEQPPAGPGGEQRLAGGLADPADEVGVDPGCGRAGQRQGLAPAAGAGDP